MGGFCRVFSSSEKGMSCLCQFGSGGLSPPLSAECSHGWAQASFCHTGMSHYIGPFLVVPGGSPGRWQLIAMPWSRLLVGHPAALSALQAQLWKVDGGNFLPDLGLKSQHIDYTHVGHLGGHFYI